MTGLAVFALGYVGIGACAAIAIAVHRRRPAAAALAVVLWPLELPFAFGGDDPPAGPEAAFVAALRRAAATPLGAVLPDETTARALAVRLRAAGDRVGEIDGVLGRPEMSEAAARARLAELHGRAAAPAAIALAASRVDNLVRLRRLRDRCAAELELVGELIHQLTAQAELVRLSGRADPSGGDLVRELVARVESLDEVLADDDPGAAG